MEYPKKVSNVRIVYEPEVLPEERYVVNSSEDATRIAVGNWDGIYHHESFRIMLLDAARQVLGIQTVSTGGVTSTLVDVKICIQAAVLGNATSVIAMHNHPSGMMRPSESDETLTARLKRAFESVDISMLDHVIVGGRGEYYSFADNEKL